MMNVIHPFQLLVIAIAGWLNGHQQAFIDYLIEESRALKTLLDGQRVRFTDKQRKRLPFIVLESALASINCRQIWHHSFYTIT